MSRGGESVSKVVVQSKLIQTRLKPVPPVNKKIRPIHRAHTGNN